MYVRGYLQGSENGRVVTIGITPCHVRVWHGKTREFIIDGTIY